MEYVINAEALDSVDFRTVREVLLIGADTLPDDAVVISKDLRLAPFVHRDAEAPLDSRQNLIIRIPGRLTPELIDEFGRRVQELQGRSE